MEIKQKLSYQFTAIVAVILVISLLSIYFSFARFRSEDFYSRLSGKARYIVHLLIEIEEVDASLIGKIEHNSPSALPDEKIIIYDLANHRIYNNDEANIIRIDSSIVDRVRQAQEIEFEQKPFEIYGYFHGEGDESVLIFVAAHDIFGFRKLRILRIIILVVFILALIMVFFTGKVYASKALKPISRVIWQVNKISGSNLSRRLSEGNKKDEIAKLAITFNEMLNRIEAAFNVQKSFISNASHELRNPLTAITGQLEVLLLKERSKEMYKKTIESVLEDIRGLNKVADKLLMLARTSGESQEYNFSTIRIDDLIWQSKSMIEKRHPNYFILVIFGDNFSDHSQFMIDGNEYLLISAISNLISNACKYSPQKEVIIHLLGGDKSIKLNFADKGIGIPPQEIDKVYEPFFRGSNVSEHSGHGIGLSLVLKIVQLHKGVITIESKIKEGTNISVELPLHTKPDG